LTFSGTVLVSGLGTLGQSDWTLVGLLVGFGLPVSYAGWNLLGKKMRHKYKALTVLTYAFGAGALVLLPFQAFTAQPWPVTTTVWLWFAGLIGVSTLTGFAAYTFGLGRLPASVASILAMAEIVFVVIFAYVFLGEWLAPVQVIGAGMVVLGVLLLIKRKKKRTISLRLQTR
jgi:drug/metabolite transporter (DMT)-like permease